MRFLLVFTFCIGLSFFGFSQIASDLEEVNLFKGDLTAVKKSDNWGFINKEGTIVVDFRNDLVLSETKDGSSWMPAFYNNRCLFRTQVDDVFYYGYINNLGEEALPPVYLNASNFKEGYAIVSMLEIDSIGYNKVLKKNISSKRIEEYVIDTSGKIVKYLENPIKCNPEMMKLKTPPKLHSKFIGPHMVAVLKKDNKWDIYKF